MRGRTEWQRTWRRTAGRTLIATGKSRLHLHRIPHRRTGYIATVDVGGGLNTEMVVGRWVRVVPEREMDVAGRIQGHSLPIAVVEAERT